MPSSPSTRFSKPELLAPAGGPEPFYAALAAGADAIYCGMGSFNARRKADNFTDETFEAGLPCGASRCGSRVYVTVNIVIKDEEMSEALFLSTVTGGSVPMPSSSRTGACFLRFAASCPRWRPIYRHRRIFTTPGYRLVQGGRAVDRVTLSRERSIDEIATIHDAVDIELEVFSHGAICFCYSGVCLLSSFTSGGARLIAACARSPAACLTS